MNGQQRKNIRPGVRVEIVLKKDQRSGKRTVGVVKNSHVVGVSSARHQGAFGRRPDRPCAGGPLRRSASGGCAMTFTACACDECQAMCQRRPCWPTPTDVQRLITAGYADRLMLDWWFDREQNKTIYILTPAIAGRESSGAPAHPSGPCTFLDETTSGCPDPSRPRPVGAALQSTPDGLHEQIGQTWNNDEGRA
jgi:uncharacterized repeat protein (TIGR03833 family)